MNEEDFFAAVRDATPSGIWSQGVSMSRDSQTSLISDDAVEVELEIRHGIHAFEITLYLEDDEWDCTCDSNVPCCEHVVAAVLAWRKADKAGEQLAQRRDETGRVRYTLQRVDNQGGGLFLVRWLDFPDGREVRLDMPLRRYLSRHSPSGKVSITDDDHAIEAALGGRWGGRIGREVAPKVLKALLRLRSLELDGQQVHASLAPVPPIAVLEDHSGGGFVLTLEQDPRVDEVFRCGWVRCGSTLHPISDGGLSRREIGLFKDGHRFAPRDVSELVVELLPRFSRDGLPVSVRTVRLPRVTRAELPRLWIHTATTPDGSLRATPWIVYGDPPVARVVDGQLEVTGDRVPIRDHAEEARLAGTLRRDLGLRLGEDTVAADEHAVALAQRLQQHRDARIQGEAVGAFRLASPIEAELMFHSDGRFGARFACPQGAADPQRVLRAWRAGRSMVPLGDGGFAPLPIDWLQRFGHQLADLLAARDAKERLVTAAAPAALAFFEETGQAEPKLLRQRAQELREALDTPWDGAVPSDFTAVLRAYQSDGVAWLEQLGSAGLGALLADDMGLGKTVQSLAIIPEEAGSRSLVVAPTSVLANWRKETETFRPALEVCMYHGPKRALEPSAKLTLTSYALLRLDIDRLKSVSWDLVILDEAQAIKNPNSQVSQAAHQLTAARRVALTGTPVENRLEELWSQFQFLNPGLLGSREDFQQRYAKPIESGDATVVARLRTRIKPFLRRRLKRDVAPELPPRSEALLHVSLTAEERAVYDAIAAATRRDIVDQLAAGGSVRKALEALLRLRQACCDRALIPGQQSDDHSSKVKAVTERLIAASASGHRALVFSQWTSLLDRLEPALRDTGLDFLRLDGSTRDRGGVVDAFQSDDGPPVLLLSLKAGGTGLNLTAADHVFLMDPWWNPAVEDQASDRAYRIGQDKPVMVYRVVAEQTVEERILALQQRKRALAEAALGGAEATATAGRLDRDELLELLA